MKRLKFLALVYYYICAFFMALNSKEIAVLYTL